MTWLNDLDFPQLNAFLNGISVILLLTGYAAIRGRWIGLHKTCMLAALGVSMLFLTCYLYFHIVIKKGQPTRFKDRAPDASEAVRFVYHAVLLSHTVLAVLAAPLALYTAYQG